MIDTVKIYTKISKNVYDILKNKSIVKKSYSNETGELFYYITNDHLEGSYSSSISVRVENGAMFRFVDSYCIIIEGSYHKFKKGYNSHNGFYDFQYLCNFLIGTIENYYKIELPQLFEWYVARVDVACVYDLDTQENIATYINNLKQCTFPKRKVRFYKDESLYCSGSSSTLKIYNKKLEFMKHDISKFRNVGFHLENYLHYIEGFIRFECEIKKRKFCNYLRKDIVKVNDINYDILKDIWSDEFMKLLKCNKESELIIIKSRIQLKCILDNSFKPMKARNMYAFYTNLMLDGIESVKNSMSSSSFYRYLDDFKKLNIDLSQKYNIEITNKFIDFNPFLYEEVV